MSRATAFEPTAVSLLPETPRSFEVAIAPDPARVAQIRRITAASMRHWAVPAPLADDVVVAVSELVTNAIEHGYGTVSLRVQNSAAEVRVEVTDDNPAPARLQAAAEDDVSGRGLFLVAAVSRKWGVSEDGRTTWATFRIPDGRT